MTIRSVNISIFHTRVHQLPWCLCCLRAALLTDNCPAAAAGRSSSPVSSSLLCTVSSSVFSGTSSTGRDLFNFLRFTATLVLRSFPSDSPDFFYTVSTKEASRFLIITFVWLVWFLQVFAHELRWQLPTQLLNLTITPEPCLLCDDVISCDVGLLQHALLCTRDKQTQVRNHILWNRPC